MALLLLLTSGVQSVQAAPPAHPLADIITDTIRVTHTASTTHQMRVYADGRITDQFLSDNGLDQVDEAGDDPNNTTIAVMFDQHASTTNAVDVGAQGEFTPTTPITLYTAPDNNYPDYSEDSLVTYASGVLSYQITQRTLATYTNNCVIMELGIRNTGSISLTGGKLLYMVDIDVAHNSRGDLGFYDPARRLVYQTDFNSSSNPLGGFAMGISLLEGDWRGYGIVPDDDPQYPDPSLGDSRVRDELITPTNAITDYGGGGNHNLVAWLVANVPTLPPDEATELAFSLCARNGSTESEAADNLDDTLNQLVNLSVSKTATPLGGSSVVAGELITYSIAISSTGDRYVNNIVVTDTVPAYTDLITYYVSQGSITASNGLITATIGRLYPASDTVTVTLVVAPSITSTNGITISNQAFIKSEPIITRTNIVTHQIINTPVLAVTKSADPEPVGAGSLLTYTIVISCGGQGYAAGVVVSDTLPANTQFVTGSIALDPPGAGTPGTEPPTLASNVTITAGQSVTVTFAVTVTAPLADGTIITNTVFVTSTQVSTPTTDTVTSTVTAPPDLQITKSSIHAIPLRPGDTVTYTIVVSNNSGANATGVVISDTLPANTNFVTGSITLDPASAGITGTVPPTLAHDVSINAGQSVTVTFAVTVSDPLLAGVDTITNTVVVTSGQGVSATDTITTSVIAAPDLQIAKSDGGVTTAPGSIITYTLTYTNTGNQGATGAVITDTVPNNTTFNAGTSSPGWSCNDGDPPGTVCTLTIGNLDAGDSASATFAVTVDDPLAAGVNFVANTTSITDDGTNGFDQNPTDNTDTDTTSVIAAPDLVITKTDGVAFASPGDVLTYTVTISNVGNQDATGVVVTDTIPNYTTFISASHGATETTPGSGVVAGPIFDLAAGDSFTGTLIVFVNDPIPAGVEAITNTVIITDNGINGPDPNPGNNTATDVDTVIAAPDLVITKTDGVAFASPGDVLTYTITISNVGNQGATGVVVTDTLPTYTSFITASNGGIEGSGVFTWTIGALDAGAGLTRTLTVTVNDPIPAGVAFITNTATITDDSANGADLDPNNNIASDVDAVAAALAVVKSDHPDPVAAGTTLTYTLVYTNDGPPNVQGVCITDTLPAGVNYGGVVSVAPSLFGPTVTLPYLTWYTPTLAAEVSGTIVFTVTVDAGVTGTLTNNVVITSTTFDPITSNNTFTETTTVNAEADLDIIKDDTPDTLNAGEILAYTLTVVNNGPSDAQDVTVSDTLPVSVTLVSVQPVTDTQSGQTLGWDLGTLANGASATITVVVTVDSDVSGWISNTATVTSTTSDPTPVNSDVEFTLVTTEADLDISKVDDPWQVNAGETLTYTLTIVNNGPSNAQSVVVSDTLPVSVTLVSVQPVTDTQSGRTLGWGLGTLADGTSVAITVVVTVDSDVSGWITNTATVTSTTGDPTPANRDTELTLVTAEADLGISKSDNPGTVIVGEILTYTLTVVNAGPSDAQSVMVSDTLPLSVTLASVDPITSTQSGRTLQWALDTLADGASETFTVVVTVDSDVSGLITNTAAVTSTTSDSNTTNNQAIEDTIVNTRADLAVTKSVDNPTPNVGDTIVYTITVANNGPSDATTVAFTDTLPIGVIYASHSTSQGIYNSGTGRWAVGNLVVDSVATLTITSTVGVGMAGETITNTTDGLSADQADPNADNNQASVTITVKYAPVLDITKTGPASAIVGDPVVYTFTVGHAGGSDDSPVSGITVTDSIANPIYYFEGDNGSDLLEVGESWVYTASYTTRPADGSPLVNTCTVQGKDTEDDTITATDTHTITLSGFDPSLRIIKEGPAMADVGDTIVFTFTIANVSFTPTSIATASGDGSPIRNITVTDSIAGAATLVSNGDGDDLLELGEVWVYTASYTIQGTDPDPLVNAGTVTAEDGDGDPISDTDTHSTARANFIFLPIILKNY